MCRDRRRVGELLGRVKAQALAAQQHQDIPFEQVVEIVRPVRSLSHSPIFQVMFAWQNTPEGARWNCRDWRYEPLGTSAPGVMTKFDLKFIAAGSGREDSGRAGVRDVAV